MKRAHRWGLSRLPRACDSGRRLSDDLDSTSVVGLVCASVREYTPSASPVCDSAQMMPRGGKPGRRRPAGDDYADVERPYQSAWTAVPLCSVATVPLALHATAAALSDELSAAASYTLSLPAGQAARSL